MNFRRSTFIISFIVLCVLLLVTCINKESRETAIIKKSNWNQFTGSASCEGCHKNIYRSHIQTPHYLTSRPAFQKYIKGNFETGKNSFLFNDGTVIAMEKKDSGFYQVEYIDGLKKRNRRFDIVFGSGKKGQSFLNWYNNKLFQLPITFFTAAGQWSNSPGFPGRVVFNRPITSRCMECHTTYAYNISIANNKQDEFDRNQIIFGVDCEKCHGPAAKHVQFQTQHPEERTAKYIVNLARYSRQQNIDMCALCHGGRLSKSRPSFEFGPGDTLSKYFSMDTTTKDAADIDVHGNQFGLLAASKCFRSSEMTCSSCHNVHENQTGNLALFSQHCMSCHNVKHGNFCKLAGQIGSSIVKNCIDCHMPEQPSRSIAVLLQGATTPTPASMRSHFIKIYPEETKKVLPTFNKTRTGNKSSSKQNSK